MGEIEKCIESGAVLSQPYPTKILGYENPLPIIYAILSECDPVIVRALKEAWWDDEYIFPYASTVCKESDGFERNHRHITYLLKLLMRCVKTHNIIYEYARIFGVYDEIIDESKSGAK
jgi:hypothetical protein